MPSARRTHPIRWALVCALLALAGGFPSVRDGYAEVAGVAALVAGAARHQAAVARAIATPPAPSPLAVATASPGAATTTARPALPLYLAHCALLL